VNHDLHFDYTTVGHVTIDVLDDGSRHVGGTAFYSALQAARLGRRALIVTRGRAREIDELIEPYRGELELMVLPARHTTTLHTVGSGANRSQRVLAWAGPIADDLVLDTAILHLAPVARETPDRWRGRADFLGLTPQGLVREWSGGDRLMAPAPPADAARLVAGSCDAIVLGEQERTSCAGLIATAGAAGAVVAVTAGAAPVTILAPGGGDAVELEVPALAGPVEDLGDLGAGDVFAAAFFVALSDGRPPLEAAGFASAAAAVRMRALGAEAIGGRAAIDARLRRAGLGR
jgi:1D-myo-inositol 3-kinase